MANRGTAETILNINEQILSFRETMTLINQLSEEADWKHTILKQKSDYQMGCRQKPRFTEVIWRRWSMKLLLKLDGVHLYSTFTVFWELKLMYIPSFTHSYRLVHWWQKPLCKVKLIHTKSHIRATALRSNLRFRFLPKSTLMCGPEKTGIEYQSSD